MRIREGSEREREREREREMRERNERERDMKESCGVRGACGRVMTSPCHIATALSI